MPAQNRTSSDVISSGCAIVICGAPFIACLGVGLTLVGAELLFPSLKRSRARDWIEIPCTLVSCEEIVVSGGRHSGGVVTIGAAYDYEYQGKVYSSSRVDFVTDLARGDLALGELEEESIRYVKSHPAGTRTVCYVDPSKPTEAVLLPDRGPARTAVILPGFLILVGSIGLVVIVRYSRIAARRREADPEFKAQRALEQA
jgi:hypothetical protein